MVINYYYGTYYGGVRPPYQLPRSCRRATKTVRVNCGQPPSRRAANRHNAPRDRFCDTPPPRWHLISRHRHRSPRRNHSPRRRPSPVARAGAATTFSLSVFIFFFIRSSLTLSLLPRAVSPSTRTIILRSTDFRFFKILSPNDCMLLFWWFG